MTSALVPMHGQSGSQSPTLLFTTNETCTLHVDGVSRGTLEQGGVDTVRVQIGQHLITCTSADGLDTVESDFTATAPVQSIVKLDLKSITDARIRNQAQAQQQQLAQQQRNAMLHQFDGMDADAITAWIDRFAEQHLQLYVELSDDDHHKVGLYSSTVSWDQPKSCDHVSEDGNDMNYYSNCVGQLPAANLVSIKYSNAGVFLSGRAHLCYHVSTVTTTTRNLPFLGEQTSTRQSDQDTCGNWYSREFKISAGDTSTTRADYLNLDLAFEHLANLQHADLRN